MVKDGFRHWTSMFALLCMNIFESSNYIRRDKKYDVYAYKNVSVEFDTNILVFTKRLLYLI